VWLVRHGETDWNAAGRVQGHDDRASLTPRGEHQVHRVAALLAGKDVERIYSSDLRRARQSAAVFAAATGAGVVTDRRLRERGFGRLEGTPTASLDPAVTGIVEGRITDIDCRPVGGESLGQLYRRCQSFVAGIRSLGCGRDLVVVAHGGSIRMLRAAWAGTGPERLAWTPVGNAAVLRLVEASSPQLDDDRWARRPTSAAGRPS
jgi:probable phosphoglycerate mutase